MRLIILLSLLLAFTFVTVGSASDYTVPTLEDRVRELVLDNGLRVVVVERPSAPLFFTLISFRVGSAQELPDHSGLSHFLEHMLFKGTEKIGTNNYQEEKLIMEALENVAVQIRDRQITLKQWRYDMFNEYATQVKSELPEEIRAEAGTDEAAGWREVLKRLPTNIAELPEEWNKTPWILEDRTLNYWNMYKELLEYRIQMLELMTSQKQYMTDSEAIGGIYDFHGAKRHNAFTSHDQTTYMVGMPSNCLELWMYIEADRFQNPVFREFYREREVVQEELVGRLNEPGTLMYYELYRTAFQAHPYGRNVIGWQKDLQLALRSDMEKHFESYYAPNNCQVTIVGDVNTDEVFKMAERYFGTWKSSKVAEEVTVDEPEQAGERRSIVEFDGEPQLMIGFHGPVAPHPDAYALEMLDQVLSSGRTSRFYKSIFEEQQVTAGAPWSGSPSGRYADLFMIGATPKAPHTTEEAETAIYAELDKLKNELVSDRELQRAQNRYRLNQLGRFASNQWLAFSLSSSFVDRGDWRTVTEDYERLMMVTPEDIQRVANTYFKKSNRTVITLVKPTETADAGLSGEMGGEK